MSFERVFALTADTLVIWERQRRCFIAAAEFCNDQEGMTACTHWLAHRPARHWCLLLDIPGEDFELQTIPPLGRIDRQRLRSARLSQFHADASLRGAKLQPGPANAAGGYHLQLCAITHPTIDLWLSVLNAHSPHCRGMYLLSSLVQKWLPAEAGAQNCMIQTVEADCMHQFVLDRGKPQFSRRIPLSGDAELTIRLHDEMHRLVRHANMQQLDSPPIGYLLATPAQLARISTSLTSEFQNHWHLHALAADSLLTGLAKSGFAGLETSIDLAPPQFRRQQKIRQFETHLLRTGGLAWIASLALLAYAKPQPSPLSLSAVHQNTPHQPLAQFSAQDREIAVAMQQQAQTNLTLASLTTAAWSLPAMFSLRGIEWETAPTPRVRLLIATAQPIVEATTSHHLAIWRQQHPSLDITLSGTPVSEIELCPASATQPGRTP